jgi:hypothetical protein
VVVKWTTMLLMFFFGIRPLFSAWLVRAQAASAGFQTIDVWFVLVSTYHMFQRALFSFLRLVS